MLSLFNRDGVRLGRGGRLSLGGGKSKNNLNNLMYHLSSCSRWHYGKCFVHNEEAFFKNV